MSFVRAGIQSQLGWTAVNPGVEVLGTQAAVGEIDFAVDACQCRDAGACQAGIGYRVSALDPGGRSVVQRDIELQGELAAAVNLQPLGKLFGRLQQWAVVNVIDGLIDKIGRE